MVDLSSKVDFPRRPALLRPWRCTLTTPYREVTLTPSPSPAPALSVTVLVSTLHPPFHPPGEKKTCRLNSFFLLLQVPDFRRLHLFDIFDSASIGPLPSSILNMPLTLS